MPRERFLYTPVIRLTSTSTPVSSRTSRRTPASNVSSSSSTPGRLPVLVVAALDREDVAIVADNDAGDADRMLRGVGHSALLWVAPVALEPVAELRIGFVPYALLGRGFLTGTIRSTNDFADDDFRKTNPRFTGENFDHKLALVDKGHRDRLAAHQGQRHRPDPGTKRVARVEENIADGSLELTPDQIAALDAMTPPAGDHHNEAQMRMLDR